MKTHFTVRTAFCLLPLIWSVTWTALGFGEERPPHPPSTPSTPASSFTGEKAPLFLGKGEQRVLRIKGLRRYSIGGQAIHAHSLGEQVLIKGVSPGMSDLWVWKTDGSSEHRTIRVEKEVEDGPKPALERALGSLQETEVLISGSGVILRGEISTLAEAARVEALLTGFPAEIHDETQVSEKLLGEAQTRITDWIHASDNDSKLIVERALGGLWVRGSIERPSGLALAEKRLHSLFPLVQLEISSMPDSAPTVHFRVFLLELKKNKFSTIGLGWPASQDGAFHVTTSAIQNAIGLDVTLNALEGNGSAKVLSSPELVVRAPGDAELFSGGELPIRTQSAYFSDITWKSFGLSLKLKVTHTTLTRVRVEISTEVSELDPSLATSDKIPGIQSNRMKTEVDARYGEPLLLSGLLQDSMRKEAKGLPLLHSIPILGALFGSEDYQNDRSELVAILLPSSAPPPAPLNRIIQLAPKGLLPPPRDWVSAQDEQRLKSAPDYPWNALQ